MIIRIAFLGLNSLQNRIGKWASNKRESKIAKKQTITTHTYRVSNPLKRQAGNPVLFGPMGTTFGHSTKKKIRVCSKKFQIFFVFFTRKFIGRISNSRRTKVVRLSSRSTEFSA